MLDGLIRLVDGVEPVGTCDRIEIEGYPVPRNRPKRRRLDSTVLSYSSMKPPPGVPAIDPFGGLAAHQERCLPKLDRVKHRGEIVDPRNRRFRNAEIRGLAVRFDDGSCRAGRQGDALGCERPLGSQDSDRICAAPEACGWRS